ncbi:MAG: acylphosphatase [Phycisphaerae bacterium]|nr:acylphosphatase [Phycisphaerae bacterium]
MRVSYSGRVQGVGFRATARRIAAEFPVSGWVRNEPDGSVMLEAQGAPWDVRSFLSRLAEVMHRNIDSADSVTVPDDPAAPQPGPGAFSIRH